jgi:GAF domain-containing protein
MDAPMPSSEHRDIEVLHEIGERIAAADPLSKVLKLVVEFVSAVLRCDSCFIYVLDGAELTLRAGFTESSTNALGK